MIPSVATVSNSSKRQMIIQHVNDNIIKNKSSWVSVRFDKVNTFIVFTEKVDHEWFGFSSDFIYKFV